MTRSAHRRLNNNSAKIAMWLVAHLRGFNPVTAEDVRATASSVCRGWRAVELEEIRHEVDWHRVAEIVNRRKVIAFNERLLATKTTRAFVCNDDAFIAIERRRERPQPWRFVGPPPEYLPRRRW